MNISTTETIVDNDYGAGIFGLLSHLDSATLIGAFSGAVIFILSSEDYSHIYRIILGAVSFIAGILSANFLSEVIMTTLIHNVVVPIPLCALFSSAGIIRILIYFSKNSSSVIVKAMEKKE